MGHRCRRSSWIGYGSAAHSGSRCEKSVAQSETGPVMISLRVPSGSPPSGGSGSRLKRSSMVMSGLPDEVDRLFGAAEHGAAGVGHGARRDHAVTEHGPVALAVLAEQSGRQVVAPPVSLTALSVYPQFHHEQN